MTLSTKDGFFGAPSLPDSAVNGVPSDSNQSGPFRCGMDFASCFKAKIGAFIVVLLVNVCPSAIARLVIPVHVDAIKRSELWGMPHVGKECLEVLPAFTNPNPSCAIKRELLIGFLFAPCSHSSPRMVSMGFGETMSGGPSFAIFAISASAGRKHSLQSRFFDFSGITAIADALPFLCLSIWKDRTNYFQPSESLPANVNCSGVPLDGRLRDDYLNFRFLHGSFMLEFSGSRPGKDGFSRIQGALL